MHPGMDFTWLASGLLGVATQALSAPEELAAEGSVIPQNRRKSNFLLEYVLRTAIITGRKDWPIQLGARHSLPIRERSVRCVAATSRCGNVRWHNIGGRDRNTGC